MNPVAPVTTARIEIVSAWGKEPLPHSVGRFIAVARRLARVVCGLSTPATQSATGHPMATLNLTGGRHHERRPVLAREPGIEITLAEAFFRGVEGQRPAKLHSRELRR